MGDEAREAIALTNIGIVYDHLGQYTEALNYHRQALEIDRKIDDVAGEVEGLTNIGIIYDELGQYTEALNYHRQALEIDRTLHRKQ
jgi:tetratricopeptide (TPR) repeat protein